MPATMPIDTGPTACEVRPYKGTLHADAAKKARVNLPEGAMLRLCKNPREGAQVITKPDSGGTTACVFYEFTVDGKAPEVQLAPRKTAVAKSMPDTKCPAIDHSTQSYPGKNWFLLSDNVPLVNAYRVKAKVETEGLAFLNEEKKLLKDATAALDFGNSQLGVYAINYAEPPKCRTKQGFFHERFAACYEAVIYNASVRGGWTLHVALRKSGEYKFIESARKAK